MYFLRSASPQFVVTRDHGIRKVTASSLLKMLTFDWSSFSICDALGNFWNMNIRHSCRLQSFRIMTVLAQCMSCSVYLSSLCALKSIAMLIFLVLILLYYSYLFIYFRWRCVIIHWRRLTSEVEPRIIIVIYDTYWYEIELNYNKKVKKGDKTGKN